MLRRHFNFRLVSLLSYAATGLSIGRAEAAGTSSLLKFSMADGAVVAVEQQGSGPSILLVHGASGSRLSWEGNLHDAPPALLRFRQECGLH
jgi:pimeloyl-ACP methyl ester carboxylesterase